MKRFCTFAIAVVFASAFAVTAEDSKELAKGDKVGQFYVMDVTGGKAGEKVCYRCMYGNNAVCCLFTTSVNDTFVKAVKDLDKKCGENKDLKAFVVYCTDDTAAAEKKLKEVAKDNEIKNVPLTVFEGKAGPGEYKLSKDSETTLMCWNKGKVEKTKTYAAGKFCNECCGEQVASFIKEGVKSAAN